MINTLSELAFMAGLQVVVVKLDKAKFSKNKCLCLKIEGSLPQNFSYPLI
jgi:hypothetical protein